MPEDAPRRIRIYCLCGQKMKIEPKMYGRDGKCVSCKQKIRIPRREEIAEGTREIYLSAHPEFLRTPPRLPKAPPKASKQDTLALARQVASAEEQAAVSAEETPEDVVLGASGDTAPEATAESSPALEICEPLHEICSFQHRIEQDLRQVKAGKGNMDKSSLMAYAALLRRIREDMAQEFRSLMGEVNSRLEVVEQEINETLVRLRLGEMAYPEFQDRIVPLRRQREYFVYCLQNLQGWLHVSHPAEMGGLLPVRYEDIPCATPQIQLPAPPKPGESLVELHLGHYREALKRRAQTEKRRDAQSGKRSDAGEAAKTPPPAQAQAEVEERRAQTAVQYYRERLDQLLQDCEGDIQALKAALNREEPTEKASLLDISVRRQREKGWRKALNDNVRIRSLLRRALAATTPEAAPHAPKALMAQLAFTKSARIQMDSWTVWLCSLILMLGILLPITRESIDDAAIARSVTLGYFFTASALAAVALVPMRLTRGILLCVVWAIASSAWGYYLVYLRTDFGPTLQSMGRDPYWYLAPGVLLLICAFIMAGCAALISLYPFPRFRAIPFALIGLLVFGGLFYVGDSFGVFQPQPVLAADQVQQMQGAGGMGNRQITIPIDNRGNRPMYVTSAQDAREGFVAQLEPVEVYAQAVNASEAPTAPNAFRIADNRSWTTIAQSAAYNIRISGGDRALLRYELPPGRYNFTLRSTMEPHRIVQSMQLEVGERAPDQERTPTTQAIAHAEDAVTSPPPFPNAQTPMREERLQLEETAAETPQDDEDTHDDVEAPDTAPLFPPDNDTEVILELRGVMDGEHTAPLFALSVRYPSGSTINDRYYLSEEIFPPWVAHEFNPARKTLTITDGDQFIVMERGRGIRLSASGEYLGVE